MRTELLQAGRLALRQEGEMWVAYYALPGTMKDALVLGSVAMGAVGPRADRKRQFMKLMMDVVSDLLEDATGARPVWPEPEGHPAPEHERAGRA